MAWLIYGANGYTGELIAREAVRRGERPVLAGRSPEKIEPLARELGLESRIFSVDAPDLSGVALVLHCAGPFSRTSEPMVRACLAAKAHYLDITGEIAVFESVLARDAAAKNAGVALLPGVGFDVVPTDCLAALLHEQLPDATELQLAFHAPRAGLSRGTMKTVLEGIGDGGAIRRDGRIVRVPTAYDVREIPFSSGPRTAMTIPWGDVATAFHTTGIPNIRVYRSTSPKTIRRMRMMRPLLPLANWRPIARYLDRRANQISGPNAEQRAQNRMYLWGRVANARGEEKTMTLTVSEGYAFTVESALLAVQRVLAAPRAGAFTPARYFGPRFVFSVPGTTTP